MDDDCQSYAAATAYYFLFALFPFFLFLTTLMGYLPVPDLLANALDYTQKILPKQAFDMLEDNVLKLFTNKKTGLLSLGVLLALWSASSAVISVMNVMNRLYQVKEGRPFWKVRLIAFFLVIALSLLFLLSLILVMFGPRIGGLIAKFAHLGPLFERTWNILSIPVIPLMLILAVALIYFFTPDVKQKWRWITPGSVFAIPCWIFTSLAFSFYINNFGSYDKTYGSIGAVIVMLLWLYISGFIIFVGAVINAVIEHASVRGKEPGEKVEGERKGSGSLR
jgi:membrane protein